MGEPDAQMIVKKMNEQLSRQLAAAFHAVAKTAMEGANECQDDTLSAFDKVRKAHTRIALLVDDAMRGLASANEALIDNMMILSSVIAAGPNR